jgi:hypothetical protein
MVVEMQIATEIRRAPKTHDASPAVERGRESK